MISLKVSEGYIPPFDINESTAKNEYILEIGNCVYLLDRKYHNDLNKARSMIRISDMKEEYEQEIKSLKDNSEKLKEQHALLIENIQSHYKNVISKMETNLTDEYENKLNRSKERYESDIKAITESNNLIKDNHSNELNKSKERYESNIKSITEHINNLTNEYETKLNRSKERYESDIKNITEQINNITARKDTELNELKDRYESIIKTITESNNLIKDNHINELSKLKENLTETNDMKINLLNQQLTFKTNELNELKQRLTNEFKEREIQYINTINFERSRINTLSDKLTDQLQKKNVSSTEIGIIGEEMIEQWVRDIYPSADIIDKSHETAKGDYHIKISNKIILFEIKNKKTITNTDIQKFTRDIEENKYDIHAGLFITINTPSIPNKGDFALEYIDNIPVIYLHVPDRQTLRVAIKTLNYLNTKEDEYLLTLLINNIYKTTKTISSISSAIAKNNEDCKTNIDSLKKEIKTQIDALDKLFTDSPELKIESSKQSLDYSPGEIKTIQEVYNKNRKAKLSDYIKALGVTSKYIQDRGGITKIKSIIDLYLSSLLANPPLLMI